MSKHTRKHSTKSMLAWAAMVGIVGWAIFVVMAVKAPAQEDSPWVRPAIRKQYGCYGYDMFGRCNYGYRYVYAPVRSYAYRDRHRDYGRHYGYRAPERDYDHRRSEPPPPRPNCKPMLEGKGDRTITREGGIKVAERRWQAAVLNVWGERFMDVANADDYRWQCHRASTNESILGKGAEIIAGRYSYRCTIWARPCEAPVFAGRPDKDALDKTKAHAAVESDEDGTEETRPPYRPGETRRP